MRDHNRKKYGKPDIHDSDCKTLIRETNNLNTNNTKSYNCF